MGYIIGETSLTSTWCSTRAIVNNFDAPSLTPTLGDHNQEWPAGTKFLRTVEGNGLIRANVSASGPEFKFFENTPPTDDFFSMLNFAEPYQEDLLGRTVTTSSSSFAIVAAAFTGSQPAGTGGTSPVTSIDWFQNIS